MTGDGVGVGEDGAGAGHGGSGGSVSNTTGGGMYYGSVTTPDQWGSTAKVGSTQVNGGGVLYFECTGVATIDGQSVF